MNEQSVAPTHEEFLVKRGVEGYAIFVKEDGMEPYLLCDGMSATGVGRVLAALTIQADPQVQS